MLKRCEDIIANKGYCTKYYLLDHLYWIIIFFNFHEESL